MIPYRKVVPLYTIMVVTAALLSALSARAPLPALLLIPTPFPSSTPPFSPHPLLPASVPRQPGSLPGQGRRSGNSWQPVVAQERAQAEAGGQEKGRRLA